MAIYSKILSNAFDKTINERYEDIESMKLYAGIWRGDKFKSGVWVKLSDMP